MILADNFRYILSHRIGQFSNGNGMRWIEAKDLKTGKKYKFYISGEPILDTPDITRQAVRQYKI